MPARNPFQINHTLSCSYRMKKRIMEGRAKMYSHFGHENQRLSDTDFNISQPTTSTLNPSLPERDVRLLNSGSKIQPLLYNRVDRIIF